ncbi:glycoside hydrolase family 28 protein [Periconia macrospinosa]|uniref:Glycoside hydrolase family 28 protein n=1 Tax=Periconia macrospinosa TaxID=97972 RepID=A0A2V1DRA7_9PLEO|nr:glycoside hydrolase family 28 protein [Periconia macrospinosa]
MLKRFLFFAAVVLSVASAEWVGYDRPSVYSKSSQYTVKVNGTAAKTVDFIDGGYDYVQLSMTEGFPTEFRIGIASGVKVSESIVSPRQLPIKSRVEKNELVFSVEKVHYLIIKLNDLKEIVIMMDRMESDAPPSKGAGIFNVLDHGADNSGKDVTKGVQDALDAAGKEPGSTVYVPKGLYLVGNLVIPSQTSLYLAGGSVLRMTGKKTDYKVLYKKSDLGDGTWWISTAIDSKDIKIYGRGTIDGNAQPLIKDKLIASLVVPVGTTNFKMDGVLVRDSSFWAVIPTQMKDGKLTNIKILDSIYGKQNDGIDVVESSNVKVWRAIAVANDDSFSTKTWLEKEGTTVPYPYKPQPLRDVSFDECFAWTRCYGYKVGQGVYSDQDNVIFKNSVVYYAGVGIGIHHKFGNATARNISFVNIDIEKLGGEPGGTGTWLALFVQDVKKGVGPVKDILVKNIKARALGKYQGKIAGVDENSYVDGVTLSNVYMLENKTAAKSLDEMNIGWKQFSKNVKIE